MEQIHLKLKKHNSRRKYRWISMFFSNTERVILKSPKESSKK